MCRALVIAGLCAALWASAAQGQNYAYPPLPAVPAVFAQVGPGAQWTGAAAAGADVSLLGSGIGQAQVACPYVGATWRITGGGLFSTALTPGNITPKVVFGAGSVSRTIANILASASGASWKGWVMLTCLTIGMSGTVRAIGEVEYATSETGQAFARLDNAGAVITLDNRGMLPVDVRVTMANADAGNSFRLDVLTVERVY